MCGHPDAHIWSREGTRDKEKAPLRVRMYVGNMDPSPRSNVPVDLPPADVVTDRHNQQSELPAGRFSEEAAETPTRRAAQHRTTPRGYLSSVTHPAVHTLPSAPFRLELRDRARNRAPSWPGDRDVLVSRFRMLGAQVSHTDVESAELLEAATHADEHIRMAVLASEWGRRWLRAPGNTQTRDGRTFIMSAKQHYEQTRRAIREAEEDGLEWTPVLDFLSTIPKLGFGTGAVKWGLPAVLKWVAAPERTDADIHALLSFARFRTDSQVLAYASRMDPTDVLEYVRAGEWRSIEQSGLTNGKLSDAVFVPVLAAAVDLVTRDGNAQHAACRSFAIAAANGPREVHLTPSALEQLIALYQTPGNDQKRTWAARLLVGQTDDAALYTSIAHGGHIAPSDVGVALCNPVGSAYEWGALLHALTSQVKSTARSTRKRPLREPLNLPPRASCRLLEYVVQSSPAMMRLAPAEWVALVRHPSCTVSLCLQILTRTRSALVRVAASGCVSFLANTEVRAMLARSSAFSVAEALATTSTDIAELHSLVARQVRRESNLVPALMAAAPDVLASQLPASLLTPALASPLFRIRMDAFSQLRRCAAAS